LANEFIFDAPASRRFVEARQTALRPVLQSIREKWKLQSAADVGCGVGYFSGFLGEFGFDVVGFEGRTENVAEAKRRYPKIEFHLANVEEPSILQRGSFDLVLCVGLLYHLENPVRALRNLAAMANQFLLIESYATPQKETAFYLREEPLLEDQSLTSLALYPSESSLIKICYKIGFSSVFRVVPLPDHEDFRDRTSRRRQRTMLLAAKSPVHLPQFTLVPEPQDFSDPWQTAVGKILGLTRRLKRSMSTQPAGRSVGGLEPRSGVGRP
jgi:SAM-dependent methyltransferase